MLSAWSLRADQQQKRVLAPVHDLFDAPLAYIDKFGIVSSFPKQPIFLSRWGMKTIARRAIPVFARYIAAAHPPLLIVDTAVLDAWDEASPAHHPQFGLFDEDLAALRCTYTHWRHLSGRPAMEQPRALDAPALRHRHPGHYPLLSQGPALIDGRRHAANATIRLAAGPHIPASTTPEPNLRLLWSRNTAIPLEEPSDAPIYTGL